MRRSEVEFSLIELPSCHGVSTCHRLEHSLIQPLTCLRLIGKRQSDTLQLRQIRARVSMLRILDCAQNLRRDTDCIISEHRQHRLTKCRLTRSCRAHEQEEQMLVRESGQTDADTLLDISR